MSGPNNLSPARLIKKKQARLNYMPLIIAATVLLAFGGVIGYTMIERANRQHKQAAAQAETGAMPATAPDFLAARAVESTSVYSAPSPPIPPPAPMQPQQMGPTMDDPRSRAWQSYYQQFAQLQAEKDSAAAKAMTADTDTQGQGSGKGGPIANLSLPGLPGATPGDADVLPAAGTDKGAMAEKRAFLGQKGDVFGANEDLQGSMHGPKPDTVMEGTAIPGIMQGGMNSDMPGMVVGRVLVNVYDSETGAALLIPQNSTLVGTYDNSVSNGQERIGVVWNRIIFPDTSSRQIGAMEGADQGGYAGFHDLVDTHFWDKFWSQTLISIGGAAAQLSQPQQSAFSGYSPTSVGAGAMTQGYSALAQKYAEVGLSIPNTLEVRPGYRFVVMVNKDMTLPPYVDHRDVQAQTGAPIGPVMQ